MAVKKTRLDNGPYDGGFPLTPSDSTTLTGVRGLYIGGAGVVMVEMLNPETPGATVPFVAVAGTVLPIAVERVLATGTTATSINALR